MANEWKEWYLGDYKVCRGSRNGEPEMALYEKDSVTNKYELLMQVIGMSDADTDLLTHTIIKKYDKEKVFSKGAQLGKGKTTTSH